MPVVSKSDCFCRFALFIDQKYKLALVELWKTYCYTNKMRFTRFMDIQSFQIVQRILLCKATHMILHNHLKWEWKSISHLNRCSKYDATRLTILLYLFKLRDKVSISWFSFHAFPIFLLGEVLKVNHAPEVAILIRINYDTYGKVSVIDRDCIFLAGHYRDSIASGRIFEHYTNIVFCMILQ